MNALTQILESEETLLDLGNYATLSHELPAKEALFQEIRTSWPHIDPLETLPKEVAKSLLEALQKLQNATGIHVTKSKNALEKNQSYVERFRRYKQDKLASLAPYTTNPLFTKQVGINLAARKMGSSVTGISNLMNQQC